MKFIFMIIATIIIYIFLNSRKKEYDDNSNNLLYIPIILYTGYYFFYNKTNLVTVPVPIDNISNNIPIQYSEELLSAPYPSSSNSFFTK